MKLQLSQILDSQGAILRLSSERFPAVIAYRIQKNMRALDAERKTCEKAMIDMIMNKYNGKEKSPGVYEAADDKREECQAELNTLRDETVDISIIKIPLDALREIAPLDLMALEFMFEEPTAAAKEEIKPPSQKHKRRPN